MSKIEKAIDYIDSHFSSDVSAESVAEICGCSVFYLPKLFRTQLGMSYQDYVIFRRMQHAKKLLASQKQCKVSSVAMESGFNDDAYFCRVFKRETGMTPMQFRALHQDYGEAVL